jgi:hypothetical protein
MNISARGLETFLGMGAGDRVAGTGGCDRLCATGIRPGRDRGIQGSVHGSGAGRGMKMTLTQAALEDLRSIRKYTFET